MAFPHYSKDWSSELEQKKPEIFVEVRGESGVLLQNIHAEEWADEARTYENSMYWTTNPWLMLRYKPNAPSSYTRSNDELYALADKLLKQRPVGGVTIPQEAIAMTRPDLEDEDIEIDSSRELRAMAVPMTAILSLLLAIALFSRWRQRRRL